MDRYLARPTGEVLAIPVWGVWDVSLEHFVFEGCPQDKAETYAEFMNSIQVISYG